jgi:hypothetical protein
MWEGDRFIVRRSAAMLAFQIVAACLGIGIGISVWALGWAQPPLEGGRSAIAWLVLWGSAAALLLLVLRAREPTEMLALDAEGLTWWKADRMIGWAEIERITIDSYRSTFYLHIVLRDTAGGVDTGPPDPFEAFGSFLSRSDLSLKLSSSKARRGPVRDALEQLAPADVELLPARNY